MAQTGIETEEVLQGIIRKTKPDLVIVVDALASRSVQRLCTTVQITDTGIEPGAGVGNRRKELTKKTLGIPVVAIGVPTVVDAATIISDHLEHVLEKQGYSEEEIERFIYEILTEETTDVMVTPKNIDESVNQITKDLAKVYEERMKNEVWHAGRNWGVCHLFSRSAFCYKRCRENGNSRGSGKISCKGELFLPLEWTRRTICVSGTLRGTVLF